MENAYLVKLHGMGDVQWYLLNDADWSVFEEILDGNDSAIPHDEMISRYIEDNPAITREEVLQIFENHGSSTFDNDVAIAMMPSEFNGEKFLNFDGSVKALNAFIKKHNLNLADEYEGCLY